LKENAKKLQEQNNLLINENNILKQNIKTLDTNCDNLTNDLDIKTENLSKMQLLCNNLKLQNDDLTNKLTNQLSKGNVDCQKIFESENIIKTMKQDLIKYEGELNILNSTLLERNKELNDLNEENNKLKNDNINLSQEIKRILTENEKLESDKTQFEKNSEFFQLKTRSHEMELNDLTENYKNVIKEKERLKQNLQLFIDENKAAALHI
jgi:chromosome segregation ATPase